MQAPVKAALISFIGPEIVRTTITTNTAQPLRITGVDPTWADPVYSHGPLPHNMPFRFQSILPLKEGGMLADLESSLVLTGATFIYPLPAHGGLNGTLAVLVSMGLLTPTTFIACSY